MSPARRLAAAVLACVLLAAAGLAQARAGSDDDTPEDVRRRMDDRFFFVRSLDRGWEPLLADLRQQVEALEPPDRPAVLAIRDAAADDYAGRIETKVPAGENRAFDLYVMLSHESVDPKRHGEFALKAAKIEVRQAQRAEAAGNKDDVALKLALSAAERSPGLAEAYEIIARLGLKEARRAEAKDAFYDALDMLERSSKYLPPESSAREPLVAERRMILQTTGEVSVEWLGSAALFAAIKGPVSVFLEGTLEFRPVEGAKAPPPQDPSKPMRVRNGRFEITQHGTGTLTYTAGTVEVTSQGVSVTLLAGLPENMVFVPAMGDQDAFLIDRTEVTVGAFQNPDAGSSVGNRTAAGGITFPRARDYARSIGKALPTQRQWTTAAFGDPAGTSRKYPWGDARPEVGKHFIGNRDAPQVVGSCPAGASPFGCLDMAGNLWEWLAEERFIGGGFRATELTREMETDGTSTWIADFLRDAAPSAELYDDDTRMSPAERSKHFYYRLKKDDNQSTLEQIGLRCVVNLGKPWRQRT